MDFYNNSFPDHEIEIKLAVPDDLSLAELDSSISGKVDDLSLDLRRIGDVRRHEHIYHYFQTPDGRKIAKIVESSDTVYQPKRKWSLPPLDITQEPGLVIKREEKTPRVLSYDEALMQVQAWAHSSAVEICIGPRLAILKIKTLVQDLKTGRVAQIILDEARDLDRPRVKTLKQIEVEYKGQAEPEEDEDFENVANAMLDISERIRTVCPSLKYTQRSKFKNFRKASGPVLSQTTY